MNTTEATKAKNSITYAELQERVENFLTASGKKSQFGNYKTALKGFREASGLNEKSLVGIELGRDFETGLEKYIEIQKAAGKKKSTYEPRVSLMGNIQEIYRRTIMPETQPKRFQDVLRKLIKDRGYSIRSFHREVVKDLISLVNFQNWLSGRIHPAPRSIPKIVKLETLVGIEPGTLVNLLPKNCERKKRPTGVTPFGQNMQAAALKPYSLWTNSVEAEWQDIVRYKSTAFPRERRRKHAVWTSSEGANLPTADIIKDLLQSFIGYCHLPADHPDPCLRGHGIEIDDLSLALIADKNAIEGFIEFKRVRSGMRLQPPSPEASEPKIELIEGKYNQNALKSLSTFSSLLLEDTGYLYQHPEFADRLGNRFTAKTWEEQCQDARSVIKSLRETIEGMKNSGDERFAKLRDPNEDLQWILDQPRPLFVIQEMIRLMLDAFEKLIGSPVERAAFYQSILLIAMLSANPLRQRQFRIMKFDRHLVRDADGAWWLIFAQGEFKNRRVLKSKYRVRLAPELWPLIERFRTEFHPLLSGTNACKYVFRPRVRGRHKAITEPFSIGGFYSLVITLTYEYIPEGFGFGPHAFRHIVATDIIKSNPEFGFFLAAKVLHDKLETVEREYAHLKTHEFFEPYNRHFGAMWQKVFGLEQEKAAA